jgi:hypothetical protein
MSNISETTFNVLAGVKSTQKLARFSHVFIESASDDFQISFGDSSTVQAHQSKSIPVGSVENEISITSTTAQTIKVQMSMEPIRTGRSSVNATVNTTIEPSNTLTNTGDVIALTTAVLAIAATSTTKEVIIGVPSNQNYGVRVGNSGVTNASGDFIEPGSKMTYNTEAAIYVIRDAEADAANENITTTVLAQSKP